MKGKFSKKQWRTSAKDISYMIRLTHLLCLHTKSWLDWITVLVFNSNNNELHDKFNMAEIFTLHTWKKYACLLSAFIIQALFINIMIMYYVVSVWERNEKKYRQIYLIKIKIQYKHVCLSYNNDVHVKGNHNWNSNYQPIAQVYFIFSNMSSKWIGHNRLTQTKALCMSRQRHKR